MQWKDSLSRGSNGKHGRGERKPYRSDPPSCSKGDCKQEGEWGAEAGGRQVLGVSKTEQWPETEAVEEAGNCSCTGQSLWRVFD